MTTEWISKRDAMILTGKADRTLRRFGKQRPENVKNIEGKTYYNKNALLGQWGRPNAGHMANEAKEHKEAIQIATNAKSIDYIAKQLESKDQQIQEILNKKNKSQICLTLAFITILILIVTGMSIAFIKYRAEVFNAKENESITQKLYFNEKISLITQQKNELISSKDKTIAQQRQELAQKDLLISELYNDTKAQNKKLLELTESLKNEVKKNEQKENGLRGKEAQK